MAPDKKIINLIKNGGVGVMPTDTIYGIVGSALNKKTVERIYKLRKRNKLKPMIILIGSLRDLKFFGVKINKDTENFLRAVWFGQTRHTNILENVGMSYRGKNIFDKKRPVSVILPISDKRFATGDKLKHLHRGTNSLAFRLPKPLWLRKLLLKTGPLVAPSANPEGMLPAKTIEEAKKYFGDRVDFYVDGEKRSGMPSVVVRVKNGEVFVMRK